MPAAVAAAAAAAATTSTTGTTVSAAVAKVAKVAKVSPVVRAPGPANASAQAGPSSTHSPHPSKPSATTTVARIIAPVAGPSTLAAAAEPEPVLIKHTTKALHAMRQRFCAMSEKCIGFDLFRDKGKGSGNFLWVPLGLTLAANNLRVVGYPINARLPGETSRDKGSGAWRAQDLTWFNVALQEHESGSHWGLRMEKHIYTEGKCAPLLHLSF